MKSAAVVVLKVSLWRRARFPAAGVLALVLAGCGTLSSSPSSDPSPACASAGCSLAIRTEPAPGGPNSICEAAFIGGVLAADPADGLGLRGETHGVASVVWPFGYSARRESSGIALLDRSGQVVAREGDTVAMVGAWGDDGTAYPAISRT